MKPKTIEEYIYAAPAEVQERLWRLHDTIKAAAPGATENLKWGMPAYSYQKNSGDVQSLEQPYWLLSNAIGIESIFQRPERL